VNLMVEKNIPAVLADPTAPEPEAGASVEPEAKPAAKPATTPAEKTSSKTLVASSDSKNSASKPLAKKTPARTQIAKREEPPVVHRAEPVAVRPAEPVVRKAEPARSFFGLKF
jgi:hypothetical protein